VPWLVLCVMLMLVLLPVLLPVLLVRLAGPVTAAAAPR
jgi:hypothetical protein